MAIGRIKVVYDGPDVILFDETAEYKEQALEYWKKGDIYGVIFSLRGREMAFVFDNLELLKEKGKYEEALFYAYTDVKMNYSHWSIQTLKYLFSKADIQKMRKVGDFIPNKKTFTLYRGVSGKGNKRRVNGFSWTESPNIAAWYANWFERHDPAVFTVTVPNSCVMACCNDRNEKEYLLNLPLPVKPKRIKEMPEPIHPKYNDQNSL